MTVAQQTLHGYRRGHQLLAASVALGKDAERELLVMSDLSGSRQASGFDTYVTGYPIQSSSMYAFAKTWLATEMPRPGSVWTHTILVPFTGLREVSALAIASHFRRPASDMFEFYRTGISVQRARPASVDADSLLTAGILQALYGSPDSTVWITALESAPLQSLALALWDQQWAELRRTFSFSTGSLQPRRLNDRLMDLQVVPASNAPSWAPLKHVRRAVVPKAPSGWSVAAAEDIRHPGELRSLLHEAGRGGRASYVPLAEAFTLSTNRSKPDWFQTYFALLAEMATDNLHRERLLCLAVGHQFGAGDVEVLRAVLAFEPGAAVVDAADVDQRVRRLHEAMPDELWSLVGNSSLQRGYAHQQVAASMAGTVSPQEILERSDADTNTALILISLRPTLAADADLWNTDQGFQADVLSTLAATRLRKPDLQQVITSIVQSGNEFTLRMAAGHWPDDVSIAILVAAETSRSFPTKNWVARDLFESAPNAVTRWLSGRKTFRPSTLFLVADALPFNAIPESMTPKAWLPLATYANDNKVGAHILAVLLRVGLRGRDPSAADLVATAFDTLHGRAARNDVSNRAWSILDPALPHLGALRDWDRCERLRRGVARTFVERRWSVEWLLGLSRSSDTVSKLQRSISRVDGGKEYLESLGVGDRHRS